MNLMHATYVTLQSSPTLQDEDVLSKGRQTFFTLFSCYFKETVKVMIDYLLSGLYSLPIFSEIDNF